MNPLLFTLKASRKAYRLLVRKEWMQPDCVIDRQQANDLIFDALNEKKGVMISRFGCTEIGCISHYQQRTSKECFFVKTKRYITDDVSAPVWDAKHLNALCTLSGFFPRERENFDLFARLYLEDTPQIDVLGSLHYRERFMPLSPEHKKVHLEAMYPFFVERPWTRILKGKKVLVVHPFEKTIRQQWEKRHCLFENPDVFPDYDLLVMKAVQSLGGLGGKYKTWFDALRDMQDQISSLDFDFALLGCGAYGLPLAAHIKRMGKKAIHLGGGLQLLFGIKGKRWDGNYVWTYHTKQKLELNYRDLYNEHWIRPLPEDVPSVSKKIENGCYW